MNVYQITDEPKPATFSHLSANPFWMLLATMLGGVWLGWAWFAFNSVAIGSATKKKELGLIAVGLLGSVGLAMLGLRLVMSGHLDASHIGYAGTVLIVWKLAISYRLHLWQARSFELYEYFGGKVQNGLLVLFAGLFLRGRVLGWMGEVPILVLG